MLHSYKAKYFKGKLKFINEIPSVENSEVIVTFLKNRENKEIERLDVLEQFVSSFKKLSEKKMGEFDKAVSRKPLLANRQVNL